MDPNENLAEQRRLITLILEGEDEEEWSARLAELADALDQWLSNGGFLPTAWSYADRSAT